MTINNFYLKGTSSSLIRFIIFYSLFILISVQQITAQCTNTSAFATVTAPTSSAVATITTCVYQQEYSTISNMIGGYTYQIGASIAGTFITARYNTSSGQFVASGVAPLQFTVPCSGTYYLHWNTNSTCGTASGTCLTTTIACVTCGAAQNGCTQTSTFGSITAPSVLNATTQISTCSYQTEYATMTGAVAGRIYTVNASIAGSFISVHQGSPTGPIIASGGTPLTYTSTQSGNYYLDWNTNSSCSTASTCMTTSVTYSGNSPCTITSPSIISFSPSVNYCTTSSNTISISGNNFVGITSVKFNGVNASSFNVITPNFISAVTPIGATAGPITVSNAFGTATSSSYSMAPLASVTASGSLTFCVGSSVVLSASTGTSYTWSNGSTTQNITATGGGIYDVVVTDAFSCTSSASKLVTVNPNPSSPTISPSGVSTLCPGSSMVLTSSSSSNNLWSTGANTQSITTSVSGVYSVTVSNAFGCTSSATKTITSYGSPTALPVKEWDKIFGGGLNETLAKSILTSEGGYLFGGTSTSNISGNKSENSRGGSDFWVVQTDAFGNKIWDKTFGGSGDEHLTSLVQTSDGGYLLLGYSNSNISGDKTQNSLGDYDYWLVKINASGIKQWDISYGGNNSDQPVEIERNNDGTYIITGNSESSVSGNKTSSNIGSSDYWTIKIDSLGNKIWDKTHGGTDYDSVTDLAISNDGSILLIGTSFSNISGDKSQNRWGGFDMWFLKLDFDGNKIMDKTIGSTLDDLAKSITPTSDGGCIIGGESNSPIGGTKTQNSRGDFDYWIVKQNASGIQLWDQRYGGSQHDELAEIMQTSDGGYLLTGLSNSGISGDKTQSSKGSIDFWVIKTDITGNKLWDQDYGGSVNETIYSASTSNDGGYILAGISNSPISGDKTQTSQGGDDFWIIKIKPNPATITTSGSTTFCSGGNVVLTASTGSSYLWSNGATTQNITVNSSGTYSVIVADANGCLASSAVIVTVNPNPSSPTISPSGVSTLCPGSSIVLTSSSSSNNLWSTGANTQSITASVAGIYSVTVSNAFGCTSSTTKTISSYGSLTALPSKIWDKTFGGDNNDYLYASIQTMDGGYLLGGFTNSSNSGDKSQVLLGVYDIWIVKTDAVGNKLWERQYGGTESDIIASILQCPDGSYLIGGSSSSPISVDKSQNSQGLEDYWVIKIDPMGNKIWDKRFGGSNEEQLHSMLLLADGSFLLGGFSVSGISGDKTQPSQGSADFWIVKIDSAGNKLWDKTYGGSGYETISMLQPSSNGSFLLAGHSNSGISGDKTMASFGLTDTWVIKIDSMGNKLWDKAYGGNDNDYLQGILPTPDGSILLGGYTQSLVSGTITQSPFGNWDFYLIKTDSSGNQLWDKRFGGSGLDDLNGIMIMPDGGYLLAGGTTSPVSGNKSQPLKGGRDYWIVKTDASGNKLWDQDYGGNGDDYLTNFTPTNDASILLIGGSTSNISYDKSQNSNGNFDYWIVKIKPNPATITATGSTTFCSGGNVVLTASTGSAYNWSNGATTQTITVTSAGTYSVIVTDANGCTASSVIEVQVNSNPTVNISSTTGAICVGQSSTLNATGAYTYTWMPGSLSGMSINVSPSSSTTYTVIGTDGNGCTASSTKLIIANSLPSVGSITSPALSSVCLGNSITLNGTGATTYTWSGGITNGVSFIPSSTSTYTVTGTNTSTGCSNTSTKIITVNALPTISYSISPTSVVCAGTPVTLSGTGADTYTWTGGINNGVAFIPASSTTYTVTGTNTTTGCTNTASKLITVNALPIVSSNVIPSSNVCAGTSITLTGTGANTYTWSGGITNGVSFVPASTTTYTVTGTNSTTGCSNTSTKLLTVNSLPTIGTSITPSSAVCSGTSVTMNGTGANSYTWSGGISNGIAFVPATTTTYTVTGTSAQGCIGTTIRTITVFPLPTINTTATATSICSGNSTTLSATGANIYQWMPSSLNTSSITVSPSSNTIYTVTGIDANGCSASSTRSIQVNTCSGTTVNLKFFLQGYYLGSGLMSSTLLNESQPNTNLQTDTVLVELRQASNPGVTSFSYKGVIASNGLLTCSFPSTSYANSYYIVINHRNSIQTWSASPITILPITNYDFTSSANQAYGSNQIEIENGVWAIYAGDINQDENIDLLDASFLEVDINNFEFGYFATDINGDGNVDLLDSPILEANVNGFIFSVHP